MLSEGVLGPVWVWAWLVRRLTRWAKATQRQAGLRGQTPGRWPLCSLGSDYLPDGQMQPDSWSKPQSWAAGPQALGAGEDEEAEDAFLPLAV